MCKGGLRCWPLGEMCRAWGQLKRGFGTVLGGNGCWRRVKCVLRAWGQVKRGFQVLAMGEMCFEGMGAVAKGVSRVGTG